MQAKAAAALPSHVEKLSREERLGVPTFLQLQPSAKSSKVRSKTAPKDADSAARAELKDVAALYGLTAQEVDAAPLHHVQSLPNGGRLVRLTNQRDGIEVFREQATVLLDARLQATAIGGYLGSTTPAPQAKSNNATTIDAAGAIARALQDFGFAADVNQQLQQSTQPAHAKAGPYQYWTLPSHVRSDEGATLIAPARVKPVWYRLPQGLVSAFYVEVRVREASQEHAYGYVIAKDDARLLLRNNQTSHASSFNYRVYADPVSTMPLPGPQGRSGAPHPTGIPDGYTAPLQAANLVSLANGAFSQNDPWLADNATTTAGNNVQAFANRAAPDGLNPADAGQCGDELDRDFTACITSAQTFDYDYDHSGLPLGSKSQAAASVVNLFYITNWLHDWFYDFGFDEKSGNAQSSNYGRGGLEGDPLIAQALDHSGTDNANMFTPADGQSPIMRMFRFINMTSQASVQAPSTMTGPIISAPARFGVWAYDITHETAKAAPFEACTQLTNPAEIAGKIALVGRSDSCSFVSKVLNAQAAGALGVVVVQNRPDPPFPMSEAGAAQFVNIPSIQISQSDGTALLNAMLRGPVSLRMQGYASDRSSAFDTSIVTHEWGHFISNRLIGDANGLITNHAQSLGEGWGDFHALLLQVTDDDRNRPGNNLYQGVYSDMGYATVAVTAPTADPDNISYFGMRRYPYSTDMTKNPLRLRHIATAEPLPAGIPRNTTYVDADNAEIHNSGEVWASMLWDCYAGLLNAHPFQEAQDRMKTYLVAGYKLTPVNPTLLEARDALLAPMLANDPADYQRCSATFAKRGAGAFAVIPDRYSETNAGVQEGTSTDGLLVIDDMQLSMNAAGATRCDADDVLDSDEIGVLNITLRNKGLSEVSMGRITLASELVNLTFPDGASMDVPAMGINETRTIAARVKVTDLILPSSSRITASLTHANRPVPAEYEIRVPLQRDVAPNRLTSDDAEALPSVMNFGSTAAAFTDTWAARVIDEPGAPFDRRYTSRAPGVQGSHWMRTPPLQVSTTEDFKIAFKHRFFFETDADYQFDGGQLMLSTDNGNTWSSVGTPLYNGIIDTGYGGNPVDGEPAFVGRSPDLPDMTPVELNLGSTYAGQTVQFAWVIHTDMAYDTVGWEVDDIVFSGITNTPFPQLLADAQTCASGAVSLIAVAGSDQSAQVNTAFAQPLRVRLVNANGTPAAGIAIQFTAPGSGATAALSASTTDTDSDGFAQISATANAIAGSYLINATAGNWSTSFALTNTSVPEQPGGGTPEPLSISGPAPNGQGTVTITTHGATTALTASAQFSNAAFGDESSVGVPALTGHRFPYGLARFKLENVGPGNAVTLHIHYPSAVPAQSQYWKYGKTTPNGSAEWHVIPMTPIDTNTIAITLTDGATGDTDALADGTITDPGGLAIPTTIEPEPGEGGDPKVTPVPTLSNTLLIALALALGWLGANQVLRPRRLRK